MKKKLVLSVFSVSFLVLILKRIGREGKKLIATECHEEFWRWLCGVWDEYASLDSYIRDQRTFGNRVWHEGIDRHLIGLFHELNHYPASADLGFGKEFENKCFDLRTKALLQWAEIKKLVLSGERDGLFVHSRELGDLLTQLNKLGAKMREERFRKGVV